MVEQFLRRITGETRLIRLVLNLVELHMKPNTVAGARSAVKTTNRMFDQSVDPEGLICLGLADDRGRITQAPATNHEAFLYERLAIFRELMARPYVMGRDLIEAGLRPGVEFTEILHHAHKLRLAGVPKESALTQTLAYARTISGK
jgi:tRNA nucleotidyltransferase (CCA-adding enzyme)